MAIPLGNDQPGAAARVAERSAGIVLPRRKLHTARLRNAVKEVLERREYRNAAQRLQVEMRKIDGLEIAANVIEEALELRALAAAATHGPLHAS